MRVGSDWNHYAYTYGEGQRAEVRFDLELALLPAPATHQRCVRICLHGPVADFEPRLAEVLEGVDCWLVGVLQYAGVTAFVLQVEDAVAFDARRPAVEAVAPAPLALEHSHGWGFFDDRVCPSEADWRRITDREQVERLQRTGVDVRAEGPVTHAFYGSAGGLRRIAERLALEDFETLSLSGDRLVVRGVHSLAEVSSRTVPLARLARSAGAAYDGWRVS